MSKKNILKRIAAVMLAFVTVLTAVLGINLDNAKAASGMEVGTKVFQDPGFDVFGDGRHSTFTVKFAGGQNAYCVEYGVDIIDLGSFIPTDRPDVVLGPQQRNQIAYALAYGYEPASASINTAENRAKYVMTQTIIWCITEGYWGSPMVSTARDRMAAAFNSVYSNVSIQFCQEYFNKLRSDMTLAMEQTVPSFSANKYENAQTITLNWNAANRRYQRTLTDANGVLSAFDFSSLSAQGINHTISGNNIIFYTSASNAGMTTPVLTVNPKEGSYADEHCTTNVIYWGNGTSDQTIVTRTMIPDPVKAFVKFNTETQTLRIKKVSSDNGEPLNNVTFDIYKDAACTSLVKSVVTQTIGEEIGVADVTGLGVGLTYYIKERAGAGATNHQLLKDPVPVTIKSSDNVITISNNRVPVTIELTKTDEKTGAGVAGAVYSLYARENIKAAAGDTVLYEAGEWVADFPETDVNGKATLENLYIGKYFVKEKSAPPSGEYLLDTTEYEVDASASSKDFASDAVIRVNVSVVEKRSPGLIKIEKTDSETGEKLSGAEFGIYSDNACTKLVQTLITDENGAAVSETLNEGTYYVKELKAPAGYATDVTVHSADVAPAKAAIVKAQNDPITVTITKTSVTGDCPEIPGATLVIKDSEGNEVESWVSTTEPHMIERLPAGTYTLTELRTPFGYQVAETVEFTVLDTGEIQSVTMVDAETYGKVIINKTDEATGKELSGVEFEVRYAADVLDASGSVVITAGTVADTLITDENGYAESKLLPIGTYGAEGWTSYIEYELVETETLEGYVLDDTVYEVQFEYVDDKTPVIEKTFDITNDFTKVQITKTSVTGDCPEVPGATLVIKDSEGNEVESWVSTTEPHMIERLPVGTYTLTELRTPFGYQVAETVEFTVLDTGEIQSVTMVDAETYGKVIINKTDEKTGKALSGVEFEVRYAADVLDASGSVVITAGTVADTLVTNENGYAESKLLPIGTYGPEGWTSYIEYELQETKAANGYLLNDTVYEVDFDYVDDTTPVVEKVFDIGNTPGEADLKVSKETISRTQAGDTYKYVVTQILNNSNVSMENFTVTDLLPDEVQLTELHTGTYSSELELTVQYMTYSSSEWITIAEHLSSTKNNIISFKDVGEQIKAFRICFGTVPAGFTIDKEPVYFTKVYEDTDVKEELDNIITLTGTWNDNEYQDKDETRTLLFEGSIIQTPPTPPAPSTGDTAHIAVWAVLAGLGLSAAAVLLILKKRRAVSK